MKRLSSVELFAGAGGLSIATTEAGFDHVAVLEWDKWCCETIRQNKKNGHKRAKRCLSKRWTSPSSITQLYRKTLSL